jgi:hypothetical protein
MLGRYGKGDKCLNQNTGGAFLTWPEILWQSALRATG